MRIRTKLNFRVSIKIRYLNISLAGLFLLTCSILIGFCVEHLFKWLLKYLTDWSTLMAVILLGYCVSGFLMLRLEEHAIRLDGDNSLIVGNQSIYDMSAEFKFPSNFSLDSTNKDEMIKIVCMIKLIFQSYCS